MIIIIILIGQRIDSYVIVKDTNGNVSFLILRTNMGTHLFCHWCYPPPPMTARLTHSVSGVKMYSFTHITMTLQFPGNVSTIHLELSNSEHHHKILTCQIPLCRLVWAKSTRCQLGHSEGWWKATLSANGWDWCVNC